MPKVKITKAPTGSQADYGLVRKSNVPQTGDSDRKVKNTMTALKGEDRAKANIEVEGGETVFGDVNRDGYVELFEFKGKRHSNGGMDVDIPEGSFIFSDTKKLKIKDKEMLKQYFGLSSKRSGYTPAEISKKFQINEFIDILKNPESDEMAKRSADEMIKNNMQKLGLLAFVQESIKGFPDGIPDIAQMALSELGVDPNQMLQEAAPQEQGQMLPQQEMMNQEQMSIAMYGKQVKYPDGGGLPTLNPLMRFLPKAQPGMQVPFSENLPPSQQNAVDYGNTTQGYLYGIDSPYTPREIYTQSGGTERFPMRQNPDPTFNPETGMMEYFDPQTGQTMVYNPEPVERYLDSSVGAKSGSTSFDPVQGFQRDGGMIHPLAKFLGGGQLPQYQVGGKKGREAKKGDVFYINNEPYKVKSRYTNLAGEWVTFDKPLKGIASGFWGGDEYNDSDIDYMGAAEFDRMIQASQSGTNTFQMGYDKGSFGYGDRFVPVEELSFWDRQGSDIGGVLATFTGDVFAPNEYNYGSGTMFWTLSDEPIEGANFDKFGINESKETVDIDMDGEKKLITTEYIKPGYKVTKDNVEYVVSGEEGESTLAFDENRGWSGNSGEGRWIRLKQVDDPNYPGIFNATYDIDENASFKAVDLDEYLNEWVNDGQGDASYVKGKNENENVVIGAKEYFRVDGTTDSFYYYNGNERVNVSEPATVKKIKEAFAEKDKGNIKTTPASGKTNQGTTTGSTPTTVKRRVVNQNEIEY